MKAVCGSGLAVLMMLLAGQAQGQQIQSPYRFIESTQSGGIWAGYILPSEGAVGIGPRKGPVAGVRYTIRLSGPFTVEAETGYFQSTRLVRDTVVVDSARQILGEADINLLLVNGSLRFNLTGQRTWHSLQPYLSFGAGAAIDLTSSNGADDQLDPELRYDFGTSFAGQLGGGIEWFATNRLTLRVDARNALWKVRTPAPFLRGEFGNRTPPDEWVQNGMFTLGLSFRF